MKRCGRCKREVPHGEFHRLGSGLQPWCKECKSEYAREYYVRNKARLVANHRRHRLEMRALYLSLKQGRPCGDCVGAFHATAMQWDHPPGAEKLGNVSEMYNGRREVVLAEIAKCELVCANCHAVRTLERRKQLKTNISSPTTPMLRETPP